MKKITLLFSFLATGVLFAQNSTSVKNANSVPIVINEIDVDQTSTDAMEFIELYSDGVPTSLDGLVVVLFNGTDDASYNAIDLSGFSTDADGYFLIGGTAIPDVDIALGATNVLQNGPDAVAIYFGSAADFPNDTPATETSLSSALVYGTNDANDTGLLVALGETTQYDEDLNGMQEVESIQRTADGSYCAGTPSPRAANIDCNATCALSVSVISLVCDAITTEIDTYTTTLSFTGGSTETYLITTTTGTISGDNPSIVANGTIVLSNVPEGISFDYTITGGVCTIINTIDAETCEPVITVTTIAELRDGDLGQEYILAGEAFLTFQQNFRNQKFIEDQTAAILLDDFNGNITTPFSIGDGITGLRGFLSEFNGMIQFAVITDPGAATSVGNNFTGEQVTLAELTANPENFESELVILTTTVDSSVNPEWFVDIEYTMEEDATGDQYVFRTSFFDADYIGSEINPLNNRYTGIITQRGNDNYFFTSRSMSDFASLGVTENNIAGFTMNPNPASSQVTFSTIASEILNVAIYDITGKEVMYIADAQGSVTVSRLSSGVYFVSATENGRKSIAKLVIE